MQQALERLHATCKLCELRLTALDPSLILQRGYAWLTQEDGIPVTGVAQVQAGQHLLATLADGAVAVQVQGVQPN
jgi:exodeoxyribonuclease VII large subunit